MRTLSRSLLLFLTSVFLLPSVLSAQGAFFQPSAATTTAAGTQVITLPGAQITVCGFPAVGVTATTPCTNKSSLFTSQTLSVSSANPFNADQQGNFSWWAAPAGYTYSICTTASVVQCVNYNAPATLGQDASGNPVIAAISAVITSLTATTETVTGVSRFAAIDRIFKMCWVDGTTYTTIASAYGDTANCNSVWLPPGYTETLSANLVLTRSSVQIVAVGIATITMGTNRITSAGTVNGVSFVGLTCAMGSGANQCFKFTYSGTSSAFAIGDATTHSKSFYMRGVEIDTTGNGAIALQLNNLDQFAVEDSLFSQNSGTSPISIVTNGTGQFVGVGKFDNVHIVGAATNGIGYQFQNLTTHTQIIGGNIALDAGASAVCFDVQGANTQSIELMMPNANTCNTAVAVESSAVSTSAIVGDYRVDSGVTTAANFATGTSGNYLRCINCSNGAPGVTDSGTNNSVEIPLNNQSNGKLWRTKQGSTDYEVINLLTGKDRFAAANANSDTRVDAEAIGAVWINAISGATGGLQVCHGDTTHCVLMNPSPTANRTWTIQDASGTVPLEIASGTSTFTTTAVLAGACQATVTTAATNALTTDTISVAYASAPTAATDGMLTLQMYVTAGNVNFMRCNPTAGSITPTALVLNWRVMR